MAGGGTAPITKLIALDEWSVMTGDGTTGLHLLRDVDRDRLFSSSESTVWFDGTWPVAISSLDQILRGPGGSVYAVSQTLERCTVFRLYDSDGDGDANDAGEVAIEVDFMFTEFFGGVISDAAGALWFRSDSGLYVIKDGAPQLMLSPVSSESLNLDFSRSGLGALPDGRVLFRADPHSS